MGGRDEEGRRLSRQADYSEDDHAVRLPFCRDWAAFGTDHLVSKFSGQDKTHSAARWAQDIDENSEIFQWTPLQTLIVARKSLTGTAALWLKSEKPFKSWNDLKTALLKEFPDSIDSKTIHEMMAARKKKKDEKCLDYMLVMKEMGKRGKMPDYVAIKYIIDGIVDSEVNKMVLYGATTYSELKEKIKIYDVMREKMCASSNRNNKPGNSDKAAYQSYKRCYSCGGRNHQSSECPNKEKGLKCFKCNEFGHISTQCKQQGETVRSRTSDRNGERRNEKPKVSDDRRAMCVADFTTCDYEVGKPDECGSHDSSLDNSIGRTNISGNNKMAYQIGTDTNFKDVYVEEKTPAQIRFENACKKIFVNQCGVTALIDSGSELNLMCTELYAQLGSPQGMKTATNLVGLGGSIVSTEKFKASVLLDGHEYEVTS
nr:uncharacterized protein LOC126055577 [Helicoverpa armigera]